MARIESDRHKNLFAFGRPMDSAGAQVILYIARTLYALRIRFAFKLREHLSHRLTDDVRKYVQPASMSHTDYSFEGIVIGCLLQNFVQNNDGAFKPLQAKALLAHEPSLQELLELFGLHK